MATVFLVVLPVLAYPLQPFIPGFKGKGREGQRDLAMWTASFGYICGLMTALFLPVPKHLLVIYLTYLISSVSLMLLNKVFKVRASGHAAASPGRFSP
jgi:hypothetical protein